MDDNNSRLIPLKSVAYVIIAANVSAARLRVSHVYAAGAHLLLMTGDKVNL